MTGFTYSNGGTPGDPQDDTTVINQTGANFAPGSLDGCYVEILTGSDAGMILDIDVYSNTSITVFGSWSGAGNQTYCVRKDSTLGKIFNTGPGATGTIGNGLQPSDIVILFDYDGTEVAASFDGVDFVDGGNGNPLNDKVVVPLQAFLITAGAPTVVTMGGGLVSYVKSGPTKFIMNPNATNLVGILNPLVATQPSDPIFATTSLARLDSLGMAIGQGPTELILSTFFAGANGLQDGSLADANSFQYDGADVVDGGTGLPANSSTLRNGTGFNLAPTGLNTVYTQPQLIP